MLSKSSLSQIVLLTSEWSRSEAWEASSAITLSLEIGNSLGCRSASFSCLANCLRHPFCPQKKPKGLDNTVFHGSLMTLIDYADSDSYGLSVMDNQRSQVLIEIVSQRVVTVHLILVKVIN